jgi:hypothetical protein
MKLRNYNGSPTHGAKASTSLIPKNGTPVDQLHDISTFTSGRTGPWTERAIAVLRTLASAAASLDGLDDVPDNLTDRVLHSKLHTALSEAIDASEKIVNGLLIFERADGSNAVEIDTLQ